MPAKLEWNDSRDQWLRSLRGQGADWDAIAATLGISRNAAAERGRRIGALLPRMAVVRPEDRNRPPLPPGHPVAWRVLTAGTVLQETTYPRQAPVGSRLGNVVGALC